MKLNFIKLSFLVLIISLISFAPKKKTDEVLIFSKTKGQGHKNIEKGIDAIKKLENQNNFKLIPIFLKHSKG